MSAKTIVILVLLAGGIAAVVIPTVQKHRKESAANDRQALDAEIGAYVEKTVKPLLAAEAKEPDHVVGKLLPVSGAALDKTLYGELDPALRIDRLEGAGTVVVADGNDTALYSGGETGIATVSKGLTITLVDPATKAVIGRKRFEAAELPQETNRDGLDNYMARQAARVAAYLKGLPRR